MLTCLNLPHVKGQYSWINRGIHNDCTKNLKITSWYSFLLWLGKVSHIYLNKQSQQWKRRMANSIHIFMRMTIFWNCTRQDRNLQMKNEFTNVNKINFVLAKKLQNVTLFTASTLAPLFSRVCTTVSCPFAQAMWSPVQLFYKV